LHHLQASFGNQRRRSKIARLKSKAFSWNQGLPFAAALPMGNKHFKLLLCEVSMEYFPMPLKLLLLIADPLCLISQAGVRGRWILLASFDLHTFKRIICFLPKGGEDFQLLLCEVS